MLPWLILFIFCAGWLIFTILCPSRWARIVDRENESWAQKRVVPHAVAARLKHFEKGIGFKLLLGTTALLLLVRVLYSLFR